MYMYKVVSHMVLELHVCVHVYTCSSPTYTCNLGEGSASVIMDEYFCVLYSSFRFGSRVSQLPYCCSAVSVKSLSPSSHPWLMTSYFPAPDSSPLRQSSRPGSSLGNGWTRIPLCSLQQKCFGSCETWHWIFP